jgi:excisionase family DNA binding protein
MAEMVNERLLLTVEETAQRLGIGRSFAWELVHRGELPSIRLGRLVRIPVDALDEWLQRKSRGQA